MKALYNAVRRLFNVVQQATVRLWDEVRPPTMCEAYEIATDMWGRNVVEQAHLALWEQELNDWLDVDLLALADSLDEQPGGPL